MPFDQFERALENLSALCKKKIIISLPDVRRLARIRIDLPVLGSFKIAIPLPYKPKEHKFNGEHYWEIGAKGYPIGEIAEKIKMRFGRIRVFRNFLFPYHTFFVGERSVHE
jgi:hypothetical protein